MNKEDLTINEIFNLAVQNHKKNNFTEAEKLYEKILKINHNHLETNFFLGILLCQTKKFSKAIQLLNKAIEINPNIADAHHNLGYAYKELDETQKAINCYEKAIKINPNYVEAHNNLGDLFKNLEELQKAKDYFEKAIKISPTFIPAHNNLGLVYKELNETQKAINCYEKAIKINPNYVEAHNNLGLVFFALGKTQKAINCFEKAIKISPTFIPAHNNLMEIYERTNDDEKLKNSILNAQTLIKKTPTVRLFEGMLLFKNEKFSEAVNILESIIFDKKKENYEKLRIYNLAKCHDRLKNIDKAFLYFIKVNNLTLQQKNTKSIDKSKYLKRIEIRKNFFEKSETKEWAKFESIGKKTDPIFIIGFPRSGTTLLDTILSSHQSIEVIEEEPMVEKLIYSLNKLLNGNLENLKKIDNYQIQKLRKSYFDSLNCQIKEKDNSKFYIDRMPINTIYVGEILRIFPNAKFITLLRHPYDCVLSCFMQDFMPSAQNVNFLNLKDAANFYDAVMSLWIKYKSIFSFNFHEIKYENLVKNFQPTIKSTLDFLELPWSNSVLEHRKTAKKMKLIKTISYTQVTKPIYSHAIGKWKHYEKQISDIYPILEPWIKKFNY